MEIGSELRQRRSLTKLVEDFDIFEKVVENVKEEKKVSSGAISFICFFVIFLLFCTETYSYFVSRKYNYQFTVDTEMNEMPLLDLDMIIATSCSSLHVASTSDENSSGFGGLLQQSIQKNPTRFTFTDEEQIYWTVLRHANAHYNKKGIRALEELEYVDDNVETNLEKLAIRKQEEEARILGKPREGNKNKRSGQVMFLVSNGMGMFQLVADSGVEGNDGEACRLHGKFPVRKGREEKIIMSINSPLIIFNEHEKQLGNISHRIEKFNFGPRIPGLVTPLAGAEHISLSGQDIYRYFIKVVPTKIHGFFGTTMTYQYSVTFLKKKLKMGEHSHGGILFEYDFSANVIEIRKSSVTFISYLTRICSILGGVYATSIIVNNIVQSAIVLISPTNQNVDSAESFQTYKPQPVSGSVTPFNMTADIKVH